MKLPKIDPPMDNVTKRTLEISQGRVLDFPFAYSKYKKSNQENIVYFRNLLIRSTILFIVSLVLSFVKLPF